MVSYRSSGRRRRRNLLDGRRLRPVAARAALTPTPTFNLGERYGGVNKVILVGNLPDPARLLNNGGEVVKYAQPPSES